MPRLDHRDRALAGRLPRRAALQEITVTPLLRRVALPPGQAGALWLAAMPGRHAPLASFVEALGTAGIGHVLCLVAPAELAAKSPDYAAAVAARALPAAWHTHPVEDFGTPANPAAFAAWVAEMAALLRQGESLVLHCAAGIGRTGTVALCLLHTLGLAPAEAAERVRAAGSFPETAAQLAFASGFSGAP